MKRTVVVIALCLLIGDLVQAKDPQMNWYGIVLAGGVGERLWPYSRQAHPKQFLSIDTNVTLLDQSVERLSAIIEQSNIWAVTSQAHSARFEDLQQPLGRIIIEPAGRNTAPAILTACLELAQHDPDAVVIFVPADPYIPTKDYAKFQAAVVSAMEFAERNDAIALLGVQPTYPATGYGYIEFDEDKKDRSLFNVARFHEKPSYKLAAAYVQMSHMLWNIGMFAAKASVFINEFKRVAPDLYQEVIDWHNGHKSYEEITKISVDIALIEKSNHVWVLPVDFSWCDVGNVEVFMSIKDRHMPGYHNTIQIDSNNNLIDAKKLVALVGVDDLCVVETSDAILITKRSQAENVRGVVAQLKQAHKTEYL